MKLNSRGMASFQHHTHHRMFTSKITGLSDQTILRYCKEDESSKVGRILYDAFRLEPLMRSIPFSEDETKKVWFEQGIIRPDDKKVILGAASKHDDANLFGVMVVEPVSIEEIDDSKINYLKIDAIDYMLINARKVFWQQLVEKYPSEKLKLKDRNRYFRISDLGVCPSAWGRGVAGTLLSEVPRVISDIQNRTNVSPTSPNSYIVYAETSSRVIQNLLRKRGFETWARFNYDQNSKSWAEFVTNYDIKGAKMMGPCDEEEMLLQVQLSNIEEEA